MGFCLRHNNKSGIILIVVLWVLAILSVLAIGLGRAARMDLSLAKHRAGKVRADFLSWAAAHYAMNQLRLDGEDAAFSSTDTAYTCGFAAKEGETPEEIFKNVTLASGSFDIGYPLKDSAGNNYMCYGFQDEDRYLNINGIHQQNYRILAQLLILLGVAQDQVENIAAQIVDWKDADTENMALGLGAEKNDYGSLDAKFCKDAPFENIEELMLVQGMTEDVFAKIKNVVTVFPRQDVSLGVNINTVIPVVLQALFRFSAENNPSVGVTDADSLAEKIVTYRKGDDGVLCTADDRPVKIANAPGELGLNVSEQAVFAAAMNYLKETSDHLRFHAKSVDSQFHVATELEAVVGRENLSLLLWKRK